MSCGKYPILVWKDQKSTLCKGKEMNRPEPSLLTWTLYFTLKFPINLLSQLQNSSHTAPSDKPNTTWYRTYTVYYTNLQVKFEYQVTAKINVSDIKLFSIYPEGWWNAVGSWPNQYPLNLSRFFCFVYTWHFCLYCYCTISFLINCCTWVN